uniref:Uncharacterized protein n=1 Tax=Hyaloperonospora arabidopsidis (strain Emoy2) TaxID=559515 RepID=M4C4T7_HYAAE
MEDSVDESITCPGLSKASISPPSAAVPLPSPSSFPSGRVSFFPAIDRRTLRSYIDDLYDCAEARQDQLTDSSAIHDQLRAQEIRVDRLERQLRDVQEFAGPIRQFVNKQYNNLRDSLAGAEQKIAEFQEELADQEERLQEIPILTSSLLKLKAARHAEQEKHRCQLAILQTSWNQRLRLPRMPMIRRNSRSKTRKPDLPHASPRSCGS